MARDTQASCDIDEGAAVLTGSVTIDTVGELHRQLSGLGTARDATVDLSAVTAFDTAGAWLLTDLGSRMRAGGARLRLTGESASMAAILATVADAMPPPEAPAPPRSGSRLVGTLDTTGRRIVEALRTFTGLIGYLGLFLARLLGSILRPREFRMTSLVHHCEDVGLRAVPIVALMSFLIGIVLAFQGATQLRQFGAEVFVVDLIAVSILRELGILLTAIIVAGRTASAFTAAIGSMKMREEVDAMRTLGLDPALVLFVPRILALLLMLPILGLIANASGLFGGMLMAWIELGISPGMFQTRLLEGIAMSNLTVGLVKAPVFALIIGVIGCHAGMQVGGNAESLGRQTSKSVVTSIFAVIVADALFSIFFAQIGI